MGQNKWKYNKKSHIWKRVRPFLRGKKIIVNQILFSKLRYIGQVCTIQKHIKKAIEKRIYNFLWNRKNTTSQTPNSTFHVWWWGGGGGREGAADIDTQLNNTNMKWIPRLLNPTNALWKDPVLYWLKLVLNSDQGLAFFKRKTDTCRSTSHKNAQKQNNEDFFNE